MNEINTTYPHVIEQEISSIDLPNGSFWTVSRRVQITNGLSIYEQLRNHDGMRACFRSKVDAEQAASMWIIN